MGDKDKGPQTVDAFLAQVAREPTNVPDHLLTRVLNDAAAEQDRFLRDSSSPVPGLWAQLRDMLGGWGGLSGLAAASCVGFWFGLNPPAGFMTATDLMFDDTYYSILNESGNLTAFGWDLEEG